MERQEIPIVGGDRDGFRSAGDAGGPQGGFEVLVVRGVPAGPGGLAGRDQGRADPHPRFVLVVACVSLAVASALAGLFVLALVASWPLARTTADAAMVLRFLGGALVLVGIVAAALIARAARLHR